jgi:hypothetical protein
MDPVQAQLRREIVPHYHNNNNVRQIPLAARTPSQLNPVHTITPYFFKINLILSSHLCQGFPNGPFLSYSLIKNLFSTALPNRTDSMVLLDKMTAAIF